MNGSLDRVAVIDSGDGDEGGLLHLRRSWPRDHTKLLLEYERPDGSTVAGQWYADPVQGAEVARATPGSSWLGADGVMLQPSGTDRRLPRLAALVAEPGATLVVHRPERRAVVRRPGRRYAKVVPTRKAARVLAGDQLARATGAVVMPELVSADVEAGILEWAEVPGRALYDLLHDPTIPVAQLAEAGRLTGSALRALHGADVPLGMPGHASDAEIATAATWMRHAAAYGILPAGVRLGLDRAAAALSAATSPIVPIHRDFHEKQVLIADGRVTMLDLDTLSAGEAALDLANLIVHLDLRVALGLPVERARTTAAAFVDAYAPSRHVVARIPAHAAVTRIRLACLYAFRPRQAQRAAHLATRSHADSLISLAN